MQVISRYPKHDHYNVDSHEKSNATMYNDNDNDNDKYFIVSFGFNIFNTFINLYDQGFILNHRRPYIIS